MKVVSRAEKDADYWNILDAVGRNPSFKLEIFEYRQQKLAEMLAKQINDEFLDREISYVMGEINTLDWIIYNIITRSNKNDQLRSMSTKPKEE